jgi:signal transduction histidine kinase
MHLIKLIPIAHEKPDFRLFFEAIPTASLIVSPQLDVLAASETYLQITETQRKRLVGRRLDRDFAADRRGPWIADVRRLTASLDRVIRSGRTHQFSLRKKLDGPANPGSGASAYRVWRVSNTPIHDADGKLLWIWHRLEDRGSAARSVGRLQERLISMQEEERMRIARELHDQMAQYLSAMMLGLESLKKPVDARSVQTGVDQLQDLVQQVGEEVHRLAWDLRPAPIEEMGLRKSLEHCVEELASRSTIECHFHSNLAVEDRLDRSVQTICYRVVQEGLANIIKHARARTASVVVTRTGDELQIIVEDDGVGFDQPDAVGAPDEHDHIGLRGMQERLALVGGSVEVESTVGRGTSLFVRVPIAGAR